MKTIAKKGFTLIELLIVIAIIGILAVAFLPSLLDAPAKARDTQRVANLQSINNALTTEFLAGTSYPAADDCITADATWNPLAPSLGGGIPVDPQGTDNDVSDGTLACDGEYLYVVDPDGAGTYSYAIFAHLENASGNFACAAATGVLVDTSTVTTDGDCYGILVQ